MWPFRAVGSFYFRERVLEDAEDADPETEAPDAAAAGGAVDTAADAAVDAPAFSWRLAREHFGPSFLMCIAFIDPGNLEADLQTGAAAEYSLLWVLVWSTAAGGLLQSLAARLGVATGRHLAEHCRERYPPPVRAVLWLAMEAAIVGSDVQEVCGTAIALNMLLGLRLWAGVAAAGGAAYALLLLERLGVRWLERLFYAVVAAVAAAMGALFFQAGIPYGRVARGMLVPRLTRAALPYTAAIVGSVVMPHNLHLHSALVHARPTRSPVSPAESIRYYNVESAVTLFVTLLVNVAVTAIFARGFFGKAAAARIGLANAGEYLGARFGRGLETVWALGLLAAGLSSTVTGTYAGQFVMSGLLRLRLSPARRALLTRAVALVPSLAAALAAEGDARRLDALNQAVNLSQAVVLPFAALPLLALTSSAAVMTPRHATPRGLAAAAWAAAGLVIAVNLSTAWHTGGRLLAGAHWAWRAALWGAVGGYLFLLSLLLRPAERAAGAGGAEGDGGSGEDGPPAEEPLLPGDSGGALAAGGSRR